MMFFKEVKLAKDELYEALNRSKTFAGNEQLLKEHLISQLERYDRADEDPKNIAYELAGLMSAESVFRLPSDSPFMKILEMAGELELPYPHRSANASWETLRTLVRQLP
jgi:hypothetical protein